MIPEIITLTRRVNSSKVNMLVGYFEAEKSVRRYVEQAHEHAEYRSRCRDPALFLGAIDGPVAVVMQHCKGEPDIKPPHEGISKFCKGLKDLHQSPFVHGDSSPNILVDVGGHAMGPGATLPSNPKAVPPRNTRHITI